MSSPPISKEFPWPPGRVPLMLAPMQGLTNRAMRALFVERARPDTLFTEFMRVHAASSRRLARGDLREIAAEEGGVPLVVQLIGHGREALVDAALAAEGAGARHLNLNVGCPYGRMTSGLTGGKMLRRPEELAEILPALREAVSGTFSVKVRAGYDDPRQILELLPLFESAGVDFLIIHPRTVVQEYAGRADHGITAEAVRRSALPVIANGDIRTAADGRRVLEETGASGLMLGRGAIADPLLFKRLRGEAPAVPTRAERAAELRSYLGEVLARYRELFCGEAQVLSKVKGVVGVVADPEFAAELKGLLRTRSVAAFSALLERLD